MTFERGEYTDRLTLERLAGEGYQNIIILNPLQDVDIQIADAMTIIAIVHLRDIARKTNLKFSIASEILDVRNRDLIEASSTEDLIISERLVALGLTQIAENKNILPVFIDLLTPGGEEIYLKPARDYVIPGQPVNFYTVLAAAQQKGETAIGYRLLGEANDSGKSFGVHLSPDKSETIALDEADRVIILARN